MQKFYKVVNQEVAKRIIAKRDQNFLIRQGLNELAEKFGFDEAFMYSNANMDATGFIFAGFEITYKTMHERGESYQTIPEIFKRYITSPDSWKSVKPPKNIQGGSTVYMPKMSDKKLIKEIEAFFIEKGVKDFQFKMLLDEICLKKELEVVYPHQFSTGMTKTGVGGYAVLNDTLYLAVYDIRHLDNESENLDDVNLAVCEEISEQQFDIACHSKLKVILDKDIVSHQIILEKMANMGDKERQEFLFRTLDTAIAQEFN